MALKNVELFWYEGRRYSNIVVLIVQKPESKWLNKEHYVTYVMYIGSGNKFYLIGGIVENQ